MFSPIKAELTICKWALKYYDEPWFKNKMGLKGNGYPTPTKTQLKQIIKKLSKVVTLD
jgi:hypothetical protein